MQVWYMSSKQKDTIEDFSINMFKYFRLWQP